MRLELQSVTAGYGETVALRDVDLVVPTGTVVTLLGANGAGKTTLLRVASGLLQPRRGRILVDGEDVTGCSSDELARLGLCHVTEGRSIFPGLSVRDNLRMFASKGDDRTATDRVLEAFPDLAGRMSQVAGTLSGGQQQMLALARTYAQQARLVLLDEVSMGLAPVIVDEIFEFLRRLRDDGISLLIVEQYVSKALALATTVNLLDRGTIVFRGEPGELKAGELTTHYLGAGAS